MLNLYTKKFKPDLVFIGLFLRHLPIDPAETALCLHPIPPPPAVLAHQLPLTASEVSIPHLLHLLVPQDTESRPRSVSNPAPGQKTNWPVGRNGFSPCQFLVLSPPGTFWWTPEHQFLFFQHQHPPPDLVSS